jgi:nitroreductase
MELMEAIRGRRSVREYTTTPLDRGELSGER